jgi:hypothetical protein
MGTADERDVIFLLEDRLSAAIEHSGVGEFDGNEFGAGECVLYMYGPDADRLYDAIVPHLQMTAAARGGYAIKRYGAVGDPAAREIRVAW